jgi:sugar lactone lactonase YvrE
MKLPIFTKNIMVALVMVFFLGGCATDQQLKTRRYVWPAPPDPPRIEWLKSYYSQHDFPKSSLENFLEVLFGSSAPLAFEKPIDIKSDGKGKVYVTDIALAAIFVYDLNKGRVERWTKGDDVEKSLAITPYYLDVDQQGNIYAVGTGVKSIYVLDASGAVVRRIDFSKEVKSPAGIKIDNEKGRIYLVDLGGAKVVAYDLSGKYLFSFGKSGDGEGEFNRPSPIAMNRKGEIIVGDIMNARVQIFDRDGKFLRKFGQRGDASSDFQIMKGLAVDSDDDIYVTDGKANQIKIFSTKGEFLLSIGTAYSVTKTMKEAPGGFLLPQGIFIDATDTIYVADQANMRFQVLKYLKEAETKKNGPVTPEPKK